jgi:hypothetical protein
MHPGVLVDLRDYLVNLPSTSESKAVFKPFPPTHTRSPLRRSNAFRISGLIDNAVSLFTDFQFVDQRRYIVDGENPVLHHNVVGQTTCGVSGLSNVYSDLVDVPFTSRYADLNRVALVSSDFARGAQYGYRLDAPIEGLTSIEGFISNPYESPEFSGAVIRSLYFHLGNVAMNSAFDVSSHSTDTGHIINFTMCIGSIKVGGSLWRWDLMQYRITYTYEWSGVEPGFPDGFAIDDVLSLGLTVRTKGYQNIDYNPSTLPTDHDTLGIVYNFLRATHPAFLFEDSGPGAWTVLPSSTPDVHILNGPDHGSAISMLAGSPRVVRALRSYEELNHRTERVLGSYSPANFFSSVEAINNGFQLLGSNHIETLLEIRSLFNPVALAKAAFAIYRRGFREGIFDEILNVISSAQLCWSFGLAPNLREASKIAQKGAALRHRVLSGDVFSPQTAYGSVVYPIGSLDGFQDFPNSTVVGRSKVRLGFNRDGYLPYLLTAEAVGLLPRLSRLWEVIPFSFLVDKVSNTSLSLDVIDISLLREVLDIEFSTHSISILLPFADVDDIHGFTSVPMGGSDEGDAASFTGYRCYFRYSMKRSIPGFVPTPLPVLGSGLDLSWNISGSLIYQLGR